MNNRKRGLLKESKMLLDRASDLISKVLEEEENCLDNMPENLQTSENYERIEDAIDKLESAIEHIDNAQEDIDDALA